MELTRAVRPVLRLSYRSRPLSLRTGCTSFSTSHVRPDDSQSSNSDNTSGRTKPPEPPKEQASNASSPSARPSNNAGPTITKTYSPNNEQRPRNQRAGAPSAPPASGLAGLISSLSRVGVSSPGRMLNQMPTYDADDKNAPLRGHAQQAQPWHLHVYAHKHNTHLTLSRPNRRAVISISAGNIGFRKSQRGTHDAAYQLGAYMMARINRAGLLADIDALEVVFRGFGSGREAVAKILLGSEGGALRPKIVKLADATRLKFGGTRSKRPRRLG